MSKQIQSRGLFRLMQLTSPALPVGGFAYSQGLEYAIDSGFICNQAQAQEWIQGVLEHSVGGLDLPAAALGYKACIENNEEQFIEVNTHALALRETRELHLESTQMARALLRLLDDMGEVLPLKLDIFKTDWSCAFALTAARWDIDQLSCLHGLAWTWLENQIAAAVKLVPLGQTQGQKMLLEISDSLQPVIEKSQLKSIEDMGASTPMMASMSALHETQYSRLFRS